MEYDEGENWEEEMGDGEGLALILQSVSKKTT